MGERIAGIGVGAAVGLAGYTWAEIGEIVRIIASMCAAVSALAAAYYYLKKARSK